MVAWQGRWWSVLPKLLLHGKNGPFSNNWSTTQSLCMKAGMKRLKVTKEKQTKSNVSFLKKEKKLKGNISFRGKEFFYFQTVPWKDLHCPENMQNLTLNRRSCLSKVKPTICSYLKYSTMSRATNLGSIAKNLDLWSEKKKQYFFGHCCENKEYPFPNECQSFIRFGVVDMSKKQISYFCCCKMQNCYCSYWEPLLVI